MGLIPKVLFLKKLTSILKDETGINIVDIPGGHLGYIQKPEGFAEVLLKIWN